MKGVKAFAKLYFGPRYERVYRSLFTITILFFSFRFSGLRVQVAPAVLSLSATFVSGGILWQTLHSHRHSESLRGFLLLPFDRRKLTGVMALMLSDFILLTKTFPVLALLLAVQDLRGWEPALGLVCGVHGCVTALSCFVLFRRKRWGLALPWAVLVLLSCFLAGRGWAFFPVMGCSLLLGGFTLQGADPFEFYLPLSTDGTVSHTRGRGSVLRYLLRYLRSNKSYLINTLALGVMACFFPLLLEEMEGKVFLYMGLGVLCLNTPLSTLLSANPSLEQALRVLPGQSRRFGVPYCVFLSLVNQLIMGVYLIGWGLLRGGVDGRDLLAAVFLGWQSAILSVLLEWFYPLHEWRVEADLWHHTRKYLVPGVMVLMSAVLFMWPPALWFFWAALGVEGGFLWTRMERKGMV